MTTRDKLIEIIEKNVEIIEMNCDMVCDSCPHEDCAGKLADIIIESGLIVDETVYSPMVILEEDMDILDFICPKCNHAVNMVELSALGNPCIDPQPKIEEVKKLSQLHYKYCMYCGAKLKE